MSKIKILYAAGNTSNSKLQLTRFVQATTNQPYLLKIAAYKNISPNINIDWTLDCLLNVYEPNQYYKDNENFKLYIDQIKDFAPDLIISDLEYFTTQAAFYLNIPVWQYSPSIINFALTKRQKYNLGIFKQYSYLLNRNPEIVQRTLNLIQNSNLKLICSHFGDVSNPLEIQEEYEWVRPYHSTYIDSLVCQHNIMVASLAANKKILNIIKDYEDNVYFCNQTYETYPNVQLKKIDNNEAEYFCNLKNSYLFICEGQTTFLADAFYNNKKPHIVLNFEDTECVLSSTLSEHLKLSSLLFNKEQLAMLDPIIPQINKNILFIHEKINQLFSI